MSGPEIATIPVVMAEGRHTYVAGGAALTCYTTFDREAGAWSARGGEGDERVVIGRPADTSHAVALRWFAMALGA